MRKRRAGGSLVEQPPPSTKLESPEQRRATYKRQERFAKAINEAHNRNPARLVEFLRSSEHRLLNEDEIDALADLIEEEIHPKPGPTRQGKDTSGIY